MTTEPCAASLVKLLNHDNNNNPIVDYKGTSYTVGIGTDQPVEICRFRNDRHDNGKKSCIGKGAPTGGFYNCRNLKCEKSVHVELFLVLSIVKMRGMLTKTVWSCWYVPSVVTTL